MEPIQLVVAGLGSGSIYVLAALGVVITYRVSNVVNFAQGAFAMATAFAYWDLNTAHGMPFLPAFVLSLAFSALLGIITQYILRLMRNSAPLSKIIATLGVLTTLQWIAILRYSTETRLVTSVLPNDAWRVGGLVIAQDRVALLGVAVGGAALLYAIYRNTEFGRATTAVTESPVFAASCGYSPDRVAAINWAMGGVLGGLAGIFVTPISGLDPAQLTFLIVPAMVAALIADFRSFPRAVAGGLMIGVMETLGGRYVHQPGFGKAVPFLIMIAVLIGRGRSLPERGQILQRLPRVGTGRAHPVATLVAVLLSVWLLGDVLTVRWVDGISISLGFAIVCLSVVVVTGYAGQISLAQYSLAGIGAFITGRLVATQGFPLPLAALIGIVGAIPVGMLVGIPALRSRGINLAVATLGLGVVIDAVIFQNYGYTGGLAGTDVGEPKLFGWSIDAVAYPQRYAIVSLLGFTACGLLVLNLRRSSIGRRLIAVRENERAAAALGINIAGAKLFAFGFSAAIAALGGILIGFRFSSILFSDFAPIQSVFVVATTVLGGLGLIFGALIGALAVAPGGAGTVVGHYLGSIEDYIPLIGGLGLLFMLIVHPDGLAGDLGHAGQRLGRRLEPLTRRLRLRSEDREDDPLDVGDDPQGISRVRPATLKVEHLTVKFGGVMAVSDVSITVPPGRVVGLIGPNGAGKTTFIDATTGFTRPSEGSITLEGERLEGTPPLKRSRAGLSRSFQSLELFEDMTVEDNLRAGCDAHDRPGYLRNLVWPKRSALTSGARAAIREFGLTSDLERFPRELPYSRRRLVAIARSVAVLPSVLLLDEPAGGLDEHERIELGRLVRRLADEWGIGVLIVEHDIDLIMGICDEINVLDFGMLIASGSPSEIREHPAVVAAYLGEAETSALPTPNLVGE